ncbi:MAG: hypothetical protein V4509_03980 [Patescibacteria group bacterium]
MKNKQQGSVGIIIIILIALAAIGGGAYIYTQKDVSKTVIAENTQIENSEKATTTQAIVVPKKVVTTTITSQTSGQDCGTILDSHIAFEGDKRTIEETKALGCFSNKILSCTPGSLTVSGHDAGKYIVFNKDKENCVIGITFNKNKKCEIPLKVISDLETYSKEENEPIENLVLPINILIVFEKMNNMKTGEPINVSCQTF